MEMLILKGMMYDLTDELAVKILKFLSKSWSASFIGYVPDVVVADYVETDLGEDALLATITELAEERDNFKDLLSVADDKATYNDSLIAQYAWEPELEIHHFSNRPAGQAWRADRR